MNRLWFVLWAVAIIQIGAWAFAPEPKPPPAPTSDGRAFGDNEAIHVETRARTRQVAIEALELPWGSRCAGEGRKRFIEGIKYYYSGRENEIERYPEIFGKPGGDYIASQWSTAMDQRIDRLTQEAYAQGYLKPSDIDGLAGKLVASLVKDERVTGNVCAG